MLRFSAPPTILGLHAAKFAAGDAPADQTTLNTTRQPFVLSKASVDARLPQWKANASGSCRVHAGHTGASHRGRSKAPVQSLLGRRAGGWERCRGSSRLLRHDGSAAPLTREPRPSSVLRVRDRTVTHQKGLWPSFTVWASMSSSESPLSPQRTLSQFSRSSYPHVPNPDLTETGSGAGCQSKGSFFETLLLSGVFISPVPAAPDIYKQLPLTGPTGDFLTWTNFFCERGGQQSPRCCRNAQQGNKRQGWEEEEEEEQRQVVQLQQDLKRWGRRIGARDDGVLRPVGCQICSSITPLWWCGPRGKMGTFGLWIGSARTSGTSSRPSCDSHRMTVSENPHRLVP